MYVEKTKVLISSSFTMQQICAFVFAYTKGRFSFDGAHMMLENIQYLFQ